VSPAGVRSRRSSVDESGRGDHARRGGIVSRKRRVLRIEFGSEDEFRREYADNIAKGGIFAASSTAYALCEPVRVELSLAFCGESLTIDGEVVHSVPAELTESGATPGVAMTTWADTPSSCARRPSWSAI
jgi:Tfp pilus assembly protein PilZ